LRKRGSDARVVLVHLWVSEDFEDVHRDARALAKLEGISFSELARRALREYVRVHRRGNPQTRLTAFMGTEEPPPVVKIIDQLPVRDKQVFWSDLFNTTCRVLAGRRALDVAEKVKRILQLRGIKVIMA